MQLKDYNRKTIDETKFGFLKTNWKALISTKKDSIEIYFFKRKPKLEL